MVVVHVFVLLRRSPVSGFTSALASILTTPLLTTLTFSVNGTLSPALSGAFSPISIRW